jgi:hypothetical protein
MAQSILGSLERCRVSSRSFLRFLLILVDSLICSHLCPQINTR